MLFSEIAWDWFSHTVTGGLGLLAGLLPFVIRYRKLTVSNWQAIFDEITKERAGLRDRIAILEAKIDSLQTDHVRCITDNYEARSENRTLRERISQLEKTVNGKSSERIIQP